MCVFVWNKEKNTSLLKMNSGITIQTWGKQIIVLIITKFTLMVQSLIQTMASLIYHGFIIFASTILPAQDCQKDHVNVEIFYLEMNNFYLVHLGLSCFPTRNEGWMRILNQLFLTKNKSYLMWILFLTWLINYVLKHFVFRMIS